MTVLETIEHRGGFVTSDDIPELIDIDRLRQLVVRFQGCRLRCSAQDVSRIIYAMEGSGERLRDVQLAV